MTARLFLATRGQTRLGHPRRPEGERPIRPSGTCGAPVPRQHSRSCPRLCQAQGCVTVDASTPRAGRATRSDVDTALGSNCLVRASPGTAPTLRSAVEVDRPLRHPHPQRSPPGRERPARRSRAGCARWREKDGGSVGVRADSPVRVLDFLAAEGAEGIVRGAVGIGEGESDDDSSKHRPIAPRLIDADHRKFSAYVLDPDNAQGKHRVFVDRLGFRSRDEEDAHALAAIYVEQARAKTAAGEYVAGREDEHGRRLIVAIDLKGVRLRSVWILRPNGLLSLATPFSGFVD